CSRVTAAVSRPLQMPTHSALPRLSVAAVAAAIMLLSLAGVATAASPTATTTAASSIGTTSAKLNGSVNPNGQSTSYYFDFGTTTSYGTKTTTKNAGSGTKSNSVSDNVSGLAAGTTYHFRLVASNASGTTLGSDQSFTTSGPPAVQTGAAQSIGPTTATLTGSVDPRGHST